MIQDADFGFLAGLARDRTGVEITPDRAGFFEARLAPIARRQGFADVGDLLEHARAYRPDGLLRTLSEALAGSDACFFRDIQAFDALARIALPRLAAARRDSRRLRLWCAAAGGGEEAYSVAIVLKEAAELLAGWDCRIVATEAAAGLCDKARTGLYSRFEVQRGMPVRRMLAYFNPRGDAWQVAASLRAMLDVRTFGLSDDPEALGPLDVVFCRNVLGYLDPEAQTQLVAGIDRVLAPDGFLFLGAGEDVPAAIGAFRALPDNSGVFARQ